jgi:hypothetical protein
VRIITYSLTALEAVICSHLARYLGQHGAKRVAKAVLLSSVPPLMLKTENPSGLPPSALDVGVPGPIRRNPCLLLPPKFVLLGSS